MKRTKVTTSLLAKINTVMIGFEFIFKLKIHFSKIMISDAAVAELITVITYIATLMFDVCDGGLN